ncbi:MAG: flagellar basal body rod protein FlgB [Bacilli bacterium]
MFGGTIRNLENGLKYANTQQKTIANNLSNIDTPGFKASEATFRSELEKARMSAKRSHERHVAFDGGQTGVKVQLQQQGAVRNDGNNVDVDLEMNKLAQNQIYYNALIERISGKFNSLSSVIRGGK